MSRKSEVERVEPTPTEPTFVVSLASQSGTRTHRATLTRRELKELREQIDVALGLEPVLPPAWHRVKYSRVEREVAFVGIKGGLFGQLLLCVEERWNDRDGFLPEPSFKTFLTEGVTYTRPV